MFLLGKERLKQLAATYCNESLSINNRLITSLNDDAIIQYLILNITSDYEIEIFLTSLRKSLLFLIFNHDTEPLNIEYLEGFVSALSQHCFNTEYVFYVSDEEKAYLENDHEPVFWIHVFMTACYKHIKHEQQYLDFIDFHRKSSKAFERFIKHHLNDNQIELELKSQLKAIGDLPSDITNQVKQHYETNPYPRWFTINDITEDNLDGFIRKSLWEMAVKNVTPKMPETILVVGCGTGLLSIEHAKRFPYSKIISIDISLSSLAYAKRQALEFGFPQIEFIQMDLMQIARLDIKFDFIDCIGVLSHLTSPEQACAVFMEQLSTQGNLRFSLYSELGREMIQKATHYLHAHHYSDTMDDIRQLRQELMSMDEFQKLTELQDFYCTSGIRDLFFHRFEQHYDLLSIDNMLNTLQCECLGLQLADKRVYEQFLQVHQDKASLKQLHLWHAFEQQNPDTFKHDYVVWLQNTR